ncbi:MAG: DUF192 domain-containing protein [Patescibacteria group bacterium]|nr:DUF192 domain-containing protein [Patescibacteria group bacterium]
MKKTIFIFLFFCIFIFLLSACAKHDGVILGEKTVRLGGQEFAVEIADTPAKWSQGLSGREDLAENSGMLFVYDDYNIRSFWMKEMRIPLDIVWIKDGLVAGCAEKVPVLDEDGYISRILSPSEVNYVLEINSGLCEKYGIKAGTKVEIRD